MLSNKALIYLFTPKEKRCVNFNSEFRNSIESDVLKVDWEKVMANKPTLNRSDDSDKKNQWVAHGRKVAFKPIQMKRN